MATLIIRARAVHPQLHDHTPLQREHLAQERQDLLSSGLVDSSKPTDQAGFVYGANLVQDNLAGLSLEVMGATMTVLRWRFISSGETTKQGRVF